MGTVKLMRQGCPVGELRLAVDGKCHKVLREHPRSYVFNIRSKKTNAIRSTAMGTGKNVLSNVLKDARSMSHSEDVILTIENVIYDSDKDRPLSGSYIYRNKDIVKLGFV